MNLFLVGALLGGVVLLGVFLPQLQQTPSVTTSATVTNETPNYYDSQKVPKARTETSVEATITEEQTQLRIEQSQEYETDNPIGSVGKIIDSANNVAELAKSAIPK